MKPKLCCADFTFPLLPHEQVLDLISMLGLNAVVIGLFEERSHLQPSTEFRNARRSARKLKKKLEDRDLIAVDIFLQTSMDGFSNSDNHPIASRRRKAREAFRKTVDYALGCGAPNITGGAYFYYPDETRAQSFGRACDELAWRVEHAHEWGLTYSIEPFYPAITKTPKSTLKLCQAVPGLKLALDYSHFAHRGIDDHQLDPLLDYVGIAHIRGGRRGRVQEMMRKNTIDFKRIYEQLKARKYPGWFCLEYVWCETEGCANCDTLSETIILRDLFKSFK